MHFEDENGNEIEPAEGQVSVNISYKKAQKLSDEINRRQRTGITPG